MEIWPWYSAVTFSSLWCWVLISARTERSARRRLAGTMISFHNEERRRRRSARMKAGDMFESLLSLVIVRWLEKSGFGRS